MSSVNNKEKNFISAVVYLHNDGARAVEFCRAVAAELDAHFAQYELVVVDDACTDDTVAQLRAWGKDQAAPLTILHMSLYHGLENAMNAGLDATIGDYVYEFDSTELCYPAPMIFDAYRTALQGSDIVSVCPKATRSGLFYRIFNRSRLFVQIKAETKHHCRAENGRNGICNVLSLNIGGGTVAWLVKAEIGIV